MMGGVEPHLPVKVACFCVTRNTRRTFQSEIDALPDFDLVATCESHEECLAAIADDPPDVFVVELNSTRESCELVRDLREKIPTIDALVVSNRDDSDALFAALRAGASAFLPSVVLTPELARRALKDLSRNGAFLPREAFSQVLSVFRAGTADPASSFGLTPREMQLLEFLTRGYRPKVVAKMLSLSYETVRTHLKNIYKKLGVNSVSEAIAKTRARRRDDVNKFSAT